MHLKFETSEVFFFFWDAPPDFGAFLLNNQFYMICSFLCLISLSCLDVYTYNLCQQICFPSSLCGLMHGQPLYLQFLLANLLSFVLMQTYAWIALILAIFVSKFAFLHPYADGDGFHSFRNVIIFYCGGQCTSFQEYYHPYVGKDDLHPLRNIIVSCGRGQCTSLQEYYCPYDGLHPLRNVIVFYIGDQHF